LSSASIRVVPDGAVASVPIVPRDSTLLGERSHPEVYVIYGGARIWISSTSELQALGFALANVRVVPDGALAALPSIPSDGTLVRERSHAEVYVVYGGAKFWIPSTTEFQALGFLSTNVRVVPNGALGAIPSIPRDGTLLNERSAPEIYVMSEGRRCHIANPQVFEARGFRWADVRVVPYSSLAAVPPGPDVS